MGASMTVWVSAMDAVSYLAARQVPDGRVEGLSIDVPQGHLDAGQGSARWQRTDIRDFHGCGWLR